MPATLAFALFGDSEWIKRPAMQALLVLAGSVLVALLAQISIPLPFTPVPVTGQTLGVLLVGATLGSRRGAASVALYLAEGCAGLPVFAGGAAGVAHLFGPTGGYLVGFVAAAFFAGLIAERRLDRRRGTAFVAFIAGQSVIFVLGAAWLANFVGAEQALTMGVLPFLPGEAIKTALAAMALPTAWNAVSGK